jgi:hypothetical protein
MKGIDLPPAVAEKLVTAHYTRLDPENVITVVAVAVDLAITNEMLRPSGCAKIAMVSVAVNAESPGLKATRKCICGGRAAGRNLHCHGELFHFHAARTAPPGLYETEHCTALAERG